jgi:hypothetical protein
LQRSHAARLGRGTWVAIERSMLKLIGSYAIAKMLGFGIFGAIVIYIIISMVT